MAVYSRLPPPMVPACADGVTSMCAPGPRGAEPRVAMTLRTIAGSPAASAARARSIQSVIAAPVP